MNPYIESTIATYRQHREAGNVQAALVAADQAFQLIASLDDYETLLEQEAELKSSKLRLRHGEPRARDVKSQELRSTLQASTRKSRCAS